MIAWKPWRKGEGSAVKGLTRCLGRYLRVAALVSVAACASRAATPSTDPPTAATGIYWLYVANESSDAVSKVGFSPDRGAWVESEVPVGSWPADIDGPHGITVSPDGRYWFLTLAHGRPFGSVWKFDAEADTVVGRTELGLFPATMGITPDGTFLFAVNFNLHGDLVPSSVSVVHAPTMLEVARPTTCVMPHGSRMNASGSKHYSACMHSDQVVEIDTRTFEVTGRYSVAPSHEGPLALDDTGEHAGHSEGATTCSPTWVQPAAGTRADQYIYVACNKNAEVMEVDVREWRVSRRFETGRAPYNLATTPDGRVLIATLKGEQAVAIFDLDDGKEVARISTTQPITHGVTVSPDGRYAFITNEAVGGTRGTVDVIDLLKFDAVASTEVMHQAGGIDFWVMRSAGR